MRAIFHLLVLRPEPSFDGLPEEQTEAYMVQAVHFLRLLVHVADSDSELKPRIMELSQQLFGREDPIFLKILD